MQFKLRQKYETDGNNGWCDNIEKVSEAAGSKKMDREEVKGV